jgi:heme oxygenase
VKPSALGGFTLRVDHGAAATQAPPRQVVPGLDKSIMMHKAFESRARYGLFVKVQHRFHREIDALYANQVLDKLLPDLFGAAALRSDR